MTTEQDIQNSELIDWVIFSELLLMDEDEEGFSKGLITTFVEQLLGIYTEMETIIEDSKLKGSPTDEELVKLSSLGHYLKGSAALLGLRKVQSQCERIQNYGNKKSSAADEESSEILGKSSTTTGSASSAAAAAATAKAPTENKEWLKLIEDLLNISKTEFTKTRLILSGYFGEEL